MKSSMPLLRPSITAFSKTRLQPHPTGIATFLCTAFGQLSFGQPLHSITRASLQRPSPLLLHEHSTSAVAASGSSTCFQCPDCSQTFLNHNSLAAHRYHDCTVALLPRTHICEACGKSFGNSDVLSKHRTQRCRVNLAHVWGTFKCDACHRMYANPSSLRRHKCPGRVISCASCKKLFASNAALAKHMGVHDPARSYACPTCDARYQYQSTLDIHIKSVHMSPVSCDICDRKFMGRDSLYLHKVRFHKEVQHQCSLCDFKTKYPYSMKRHEASHKAQPSPSKSEPKSIDLDTDSKSIT